MAQAEDEASHLTSILPCPTQVPVPSASHWVWSPPPPALQSFCFYFIVSVATTSRFYCFPLHCHFGNLDSGDKKSEWDGRSGQEKKAQQDAGLGMTSDLRTVLKRILKGTCTMQCA